MKVVNYSEDDIKEAINRSGLSERESEIIKNRLGLDGLSPQTLDKIQEQFKISINYLREIEKKVIREIHNDTK